MKPRNNRERLVVKLSAKIPAITKAQKEYSIRHCFAHAAIKRKKADTQYICLECGNMFEAEVDAKHVICPHCHQHLTTQRSRRTMCKHDIQSFQILTTIGDFQVVRTFYVRQTTCPTHPAEYDINEVSRIFMQPGKKYVCMALKRRGLCGYCDAYQYDSELEIRGSHNCYYIHATVVYPRHIVHPILLRNGWCKELLEFSPTSIIDRLFNQPKYETLVKSKRFDIMRGLTGYEIENRWHQVKMLIRHNYWPSDVGLWKDTLNMAAEVGLDNRNPMYVLPEDLKATHDIINEKLQAKRRKEEERRRKAEEKRKQEERKKNVQYNREYKKRNGKLLAVCIVVGDITIKPLQNYADFVAEGDAMHHCVETYWKHKDCLILSVKCGKNRLATVELDNKTFSIRQCRAACNEKPARYDEICGIIKAHKRDFVKAARVRKVA